MADARLRWAAWLLGFGFSGFFDGILLHQVLQWHHLLSAVRSGVFADMRGQVLADGLFHGVMYLVALGGLWMALAARPAFAAPGAGLRFAVHFLVGFGVWNVVDAVFSHWITGIHRVRVDVEDPLFWDLWWLALFGVLPVLGAWALGRRGSAHAHARVPLALIATTLAAGFASMRAPSGDGSVTVVMQPGADAGRLLAALSPTDARLLWADAAGGVVVLQSAQRLPRWPLYRHGALYVSGTLLPAGCSAWLGSAAPRLPRKPLPILARRSLR